jgi:hypothetical protein
MSTLQVSRPRGTSAGPERCRRRFLKFFPDGFADETYLQWERNYKWEAHERFEQILSRDTFRSLLRQGEHLEAAKRAVSIESRTNLLFSFEKMAIRDAIKTPAGAKTFASGFYDLLYGAGGMERKFARWIEAVGELPRRQTRVLTWPVLTVFPFLAAPNDHIFLKPTATKKAADRYGYELGYRSRPEWEAYAELLEFGRVIRRDVKDLKPRDMIDIQSFIWVIGSDEYDNM